MIPSQIEREIVIDAPVEVVWRIITEPDQIMRWFCEEAELEPRPGGGGRFSFPSGQSYELQIESVEPPHRFAFRWVQAEDSVARMDNSMLVEFTLHPDPGGTRLTVVESGFDTVSWSDLEKERYAEDHSEGWESAMARLSDYSARARENDRQ